MVCIGRTSMRISVPKACYMVFQLQDLAYFHGLVRNQQRRKQRLTRACTESPKRPALADACRSEFIPKDDSVTDRLLCFTISKEYLTTKFTIRIPGSKINTNTLSEVSLRGVKRRSNLVSMMWGCHSCVTCLRRSGSAQAGETQHFGVQARSYWSLAMTKR